MVDWISDWAGGIIVAVIIGTIIEMILPEGNSKKYIKVVIGIYVLFTIVSPVITKFTGKEMEVSDILELDTYIKEAEDSVKTQNIIQNENSNSIMSIYKSGIINDMKAKIEAKGYIVNNVEIEIADDESYTILSINANLSKESKTSENNSSDYTNEDIVQVNEVEKVEINVSNTLNNSEGEEKEENDKKEDGLSSSDKKEIKEYLSGVYEVSEENITIE